jgi:UDP-N-acetylglucosamine 2-epimerase (non-hydrolysing)
VERPTCDQTAVVLGTRPEIVKLGGIIRGLGTRGLVVNTGQHYDDAMSSVFFEQCGIGAPSISLNIGGLSRAQQIASATSQLEAVFLQHRPRAVVVQGDTNSTLAGALAANSLRIPLVHVEAGLRSFDRAMPEEHNRVIVDHLADVLAAGSAGNLANLLSEGIDANRVRVTGNTVVEAVHELLPNALTRRNILDSFRLTPDEFVLATIHRPENTDDPDQLATIVDELAEIPAPVLFAIHPRTRAAIESAGLEPALNRLLVTGPLDSRTFLALASQAALLISDSGGVQEEVTVLKRPLLVIRRSTERPEALQNFSRLVQPAEVARQARELLSDTGSLLAKLSQVPSPFGDGRASRQILDLIASL